MKADEAKRLRQLESGRLKKPLAEAELRRRLRAHRPRPSPLGLEDRSRDPAPGGMGHQPQAHAAPVVI
jgi:DNA-binding response OmpR family regulator